MLGIPTAVLLAAGVVILPTWASILLHRLEKATARLLSHWFGWRSLLVTAWLGTPVHELSHLAACKLLGVRVVAFSLLRPDPRSGTLGYVQFVQTGRGPWRAIRRALVATAPLWIGLPLLVGLWSLVLPGLTDPVAPTQIPHHLRVLASRLHGHTAWVTWKTWAVAYGTLCVSAHLAPSPADLKGSALPLLLAAAIWIPGAWAIAQAWPPLRAVLAGLLAAETFVLTVALASSVLLYAGARLAANLAARASPARACARA